MSISIKTPNTESEVIEAYNFVKDILKLPEDHPRNLHFYINVFYKEPKYIVIAKEKDEVVGAVLSSEQDENTLLVGELAVDQKVRKIGLGSKLMNEIEQSARILKKKQVLLGALNTAEKFYMKIGYVPKLFVQLSGNNRLDEIKSHISDKIEWENTGDGFSKVIVDTKGVNKKLQRNIQEELNAHTQYLFSKNLIQ